MAGLGSRFSTQGYENPKPLIEFLGKPMVQHVVEHIGLMHLEHIFLCQKSHVEKFKLHELFSSFMPKYQIVEIDGITEGAACSVLLAEHVMNDQDDFMIVNSDQLTYWDKDVDYLKSIAAAGLIFCFKGEGPKWSYAKLDENGKVDQVAEKKQISDHATSGMYYWRRWSDFRSATQAMIAANDRVNNEFYVAPVYNYALDKGIVIKYVDGVDQVGTPEELNEYLATR